MTVSGRFCNSASLRVLGTIPTSAPDLFLLIKNFLVKYSFFPCNFSPGEGSRKEIYDIYIYIYVLKWFAKTKWKMGPQIVVVEISWQLKVSNVWDEPNCTGGYSRWYDLKHCLFCPLEMKSWNHMWATVEPLRCLLILLCLLVAMRLRHVIFWNPVCFGNNPWAMGPVIIATTPNVRCNIAIQQTFRNGWRKLSYLEMSQMETRAKGGVSTWNAFPKDPITLTNDDWGV